MKYLVYVVSPSASEARMIKVGYTSDIANRVSGLQVGSPVKLECIALWGFKTEKDARRAEKLVHRCLAPKLSHGEWFTSTVDEVQELLTRHTEAKRLGFLIEATGFIPGTRIFVHKRITRFYEFGSEPPCAGRKKVDRRRLSKKMRQKIQDHLATGMSA